MPFKLTTRKSESVNFDDILITLFTIDNANSEAHIIYQILDTSGPKPIAVGTKQITLSSQDFIDLQIAAQIEIESGKSYIEATKISLYKTMTPLIGLLGTIS